MLEAQIISHAPQPPKNTHLTREEFERDKLVERRAQLDRAVEICDQLDRKYQQEWENMSSTPEMELDVKEVIFQRGPIPLDQWMKHVLYGKDGYYSSGRAKINSGDFTTVAGSLIDVYAMLETAYRALGTGDPQPTILSVASGGGDLERNMMEAIATMNEEHTLPEHPHIFSVDYSLALLQNQRRSFPSTGNVSREFLSASATALPFPDNSFSMIFSNELHDALPPKAFWIRNDGTLCHISVGVESNSPYKFFVVAEPANELEQQLIKLKIQYIKEKDQLEDGSSPRGLVTFNVGSVKYIRESARVLKPGGIVTHADYTHVHDKAVDRIFFDDKFRFQIGSDWQNNLLEKIDRYVAPYKDVTVEMEPPFIEWISEAYGLETVMEASQKGLAEAKEINRADVDMHLDTYPWPGYFRVVVSRKK